MSISKNKFVDYELLCLFFLVLVENFSAPSLSSDGACLQADVKVLSVDIYKKRRMVLFQSFSGLLLRGGSAANVRFFPKAFFLNRSHCHVCNCHDRKQRQWNELQKRAARVSCAERVCSSVPLCCVAQLQGCVIALAQQISPNKSFTISFSKFAQIRLLCQGDADDARTLKKADSQ